MSGTKCRKDMGYIACKMSSIAHFTYGYLFLKESK